MKLLLLLLTLVSGLAHGYVSTPDVVYDEVNGTKLAMDVFSPTGVPLWPRPALVFIHGGCFSGGSRKDIPEEMKKMADEGFVVFSVSYRLSTVAKYPAALTDLQQAIRYIRKHSLRYMINPGKIIAHGESAGGTLAAYLGVRPIRSRSGDIDLLSSRVPFVSEWFGRMDFTEGQSTGTDCAESFLGKKRTPETMKDFRKASVIPYIDEKSAEFFIIHGTDDKQVYPIHSTLLANKLWNLNKTAELYFNENQPHGFERANPWILTKNRILAFAGKEEKKNPVHPFYEVNYNLFERGPFRGKFDLNLILGLGPKVTVLSKLSSESFQNEQTISGKVGIISKSKKYELKAESFTRASDMSSIEISDERD